MTIKRKQRTRRNVRANMLANQAGMSQINAPTSIGRTLSSNPTTFTISNSEVFTTVAHSAASLEGYCVLPISTFCATWIANLALNYSKFRFKRFKANYVPNCSTTTPGVVSMGCGYDMADTFATNTGGYSPTFNTAAVGTCNIVQLWKPSVISPVWGNASISFPPTRFEELKVPGTADWDVGTTTGAAAKDRNWFSDGYIVVCTDGPSSTSLGRIVIDYEVELMHPFSSGQH